MQNNNPHINIFIAYSRKDKEHLDKLRTYLVPLERDPSVTIWYDGKIDPGTVWEEAIKTNLNKADIVLLLISADALASEFFYDKEMKIALERHEKKETVVIPVILRSCPWEHTPLSALQTLPQDGKPVTKWVDEADAYTDVFKGINRTIERIRNKRNLAFTKILKTQRDKELAEEKRRKAEERATLKAKRKAENAVRNEERKQQGMKVLKRLLPVLLVVLGVYGLTQWVSEAGGISGSDDGVDSLSAELIQNPYDSTARTDEQEIPIKSKADNKDKLTPEEKTKKTEPVQPKPKKPTKAEEDLKKYNEWIKKASTEEKNKNYEQAKGYYQNALKYIRNGKDAEEGLSRCKQAIQEAKIRAEDKARQKAIEEAKRQKAEKLAALPKPIQDLLNNMVYIQGGTFQMGCTDEQTNCDSDEQPVHSVTLSNYKIGKYEVTQEQWKAVMGNNPSYFKNCDKCPVEQVSWNDVQGFIQKLNTMTGKRFRLPTEAEWEFTARGGNKSKGYRYAGSNDIDKVAWYYKNSDGKTHPVGEKTANELGLYDMSGNVYEWCQDRYDKDYYSISPKNNPKGSNSASSRVLRGGSWYLDTGYCRSSDRVRDPPDSRYSLNGFRVAETP